jgi:hypothetical protein
MLNIIYIFILEIAQINITLIDANWNHKYIML